MTPFIIWLCITAGWLLEVFFCYFSPYGVTASISGSSISSNSYSLAVAVCSGDVPGPAGAAYIIGILLLVVALVMIIVALVKNSKSGDVSKGQAIVCFPFAFFCLLCAILGLVSWVIAGGTDVSGHTSSSSSTVELPGVFIWIYISYFATAGSAVTAGIIGLKEANSVHVSRKYRSSTSSAHTSSYRSSYTPLYGSAALHSSSTSSYGCNFKPDQKVKFVSDYFSPYGSILRGTLATVKRVSGRDVTVEVKDSINENRTITLSYSYLALANEKKPEPPKEEKKEPVEGDKFKALSEYKKMLDEGLINQEDYDKKKKEILG